MKEVLSEVAETFAYMANPDANICTKVHSAVSVLVDKLIENFRNGIQLLTLHGNEYSAQDTTSVGILARRLAILASQNDLTHKQISPLAVDLLKRTETGEMAICNTLTCALLR